MWISYYLQYFVLNIHYINLSTTQSQYGFEWNYSNLKIIYTFIWKHRHSQKSAHDILLSVNVFRNEYLPVSKFCNFRSEQFWLCDIFRFQYFIFRIISLEWWVTWSNGYPPFSHFILKKWPSNINYKSPLFEWSYI